MQLRRNVFKILVTAWALTAAALVGCSDDDDNDGGTNNPMDGGQPDGGGNENNVITGDPTDLTSRNTNEVWGGLVLSGFGEVNTGDENGETLTEAAPDDADRYYGGNDNTDSSGTVRYVVIAESGYEFRPNAEVQGLTVEAAGSGTNLEYIQVVGSEDDCVEWFGGAAGIKHLTCNGVDDDALDIDLGYVGNIQFALIRMGALNGDNGIESDNNDLTFDAPPVSAPNIANVTILGNSGKETNQTRAALHKEGFAGKIYRSVFTDDLAAGGAFDDGCIDVDQVIPTEPNGGLQYFDVVMNCSPGRASAEDETPSLQEQALANFGTEIEDGAGLTILDTLAIDVTTATITNDTPDTPLPAGFDAADYYGAVDPAAETGWWEGWTYTNPNVDGSLPGELFHPLQLEIETGTITPAATNGCASINGDFEDGGVVGVFGKTFPVCVMSGSITANTTLTNDHIYLLNGTVSVGTGEAQLSGGSPTTNAILTINAGTQIFGVAGTASSLVITRGSQIQANGTAAMPIVMGSVQANP